MNSFIDNYCERLTPDFWAEPLNALTNLSFLIAALFAYRLAQRERALDWRSLLLVVLLAAIGTGSFLFHTRATGWAQLADTLPILFYQIAFLVLYARDVMGWRRVFVMLLLGGFFAAVYLFALSPQDLLNGSVSYAPALLFLTGLGVWHVFKARDGRMILLSAAGLFLLSLTFRSLDMWLCAALPMGTHFLWHILNGCVLYLTVRAYILNIRKTH